MKLTAHPGTIVSQTVDVAPGEYPIIVGTPGSISILG